MVLTRDQLMRLVEIDDLCAGALRDSQERNPLEVLHDVRMGLVGILQDIEGYRLGLRYLEEDAVMLQEGVSLDEAEDICNGKERARREELRAQLASARKPE